MFSVSSTLLWSQSDSTKIQLNNSPIFYMGLGGGPSTKGGNFNIYLTVASPEGLGGNLSVLTAFLKLENVPPDFYDTVFPRSVPRDDMTAFSFNLVKKFSSPNGSFRIGFEAGPSWVHYDLIELRLNPDWPGLFEYKYNKIHSFKEIAGLSLAMKTEFPFTKVFGCEISVFGIFNKIQTVAGIDFCLDFGVLRK